MVFDFHTRLGTEEKQSAVQYVFARFPKAPHYPTTR